MVGRWSRRRVPPVEGGSVKSPILTSIFFAVVLIPVLAARVKNPRRSVELIVLPLLPAFNARWTDYLRFPPVWGY